MKKIALKGSLGEGKFALVDDQYYFELNKYKWYYNSGYASRRERGAKGKTILMHYMIMSRKENFSIDHINQDKLNNLQVNLRYLTHGNNMRNKKTWSKSGFMGVHWKASHKKWCSEIRVNKKLKFLGLFNDPQEASSVYLVARKEIAGF